MAIAHRAEITAKEQLSQALALDFEYVYAPLELLSAETPEKPRIIAVPPIFETHLADLKAMGFERVLAHTVGHIELIKSAGLTPHGGFRLNITNSSALRQYEEMGLADAVLSVELSARSVNEIKRQNPVGVMVYGHLPLMVLRRCPVRDGKHCGKSGCDSLTDRLGNKMRTLCRSGETEVLNLVPLLLTDKTGETNADFCVVRFSPDEKVTKTPDSKSFTRGMFNKRVK